MLLLTVFAVLTSCISAVNLPSGSSLSNTPCGEFLAYQQFLCNTESANNNILSLKYFNGSCLDCGSSDCEAYLSPDVKHCNSSESGQRWNFVNISNNRILVQSTLQTEHCLQLFDGNQDISNANIPLAYNPLQMMPCNSFNSLQQFIYDSSTGYISSAINQSLCITAMKPNCTVKPFNTYPYCQPNIPIKQRAADIVSRMTLYEKILGLNYYNPDGFYRLGLPANVFAEALHGILCDCGETHDGNTGCPTSFPHALLLGASYNRSLWKEVAVAISTEGRAFANQGITGLYYWAPDINLFRDPRWGRGQEVPGEDPFLHSQYVMEYSRNMQYGEDPRYVKVVSTAKHYADYDQEGNYGINRLAFDANVSMQDQVEYYWPAFRAAIQVGGVKSIMCSYPSINGVPACGNDFFMNEIARNEWGFDGFFISDEGALSDQAFQNYVVKLYPNASLSEKSMQMCRIGIEGGCDVDLGGFWLQWMQDTVEKGIVSENTIDTASVRLWTRVIETGELDYPQNIYFSYGVDRIDSPQHRSIAQYAAEQGIVLLKNDGNILPLQMTDNTRIALIGPHANVTQDMLSSYRGANTLVNTQSPYQTLMRMYPNNEKIIYSLGCDYVCENVSNGAFNEAVNAALSSDYAIVFLGIHPAPGQVVGTCGSEGTACEAEGIDRLNIVLPGKQLQLLQTVYNATKHSQTKIILVMINGGAIDISWPKANIPAIVEAFYPGEMGGPAVVNILTGIRAPAAKLPYTIYDESLIVQRPSIMDMSLRNNGGITYRYYQGDPVYPFGYGLYYTNFTYKYYGDDKYIDSKVMADFYRNGYYFYQSQATSFTVQVTNTGNVKSDCVVLGFVTSENDPDAPLKKLFDFQRVSVDVKQSVNVSLSVSPESISIVNKEGNERIVSGKYSLHIGDYQNNNFVTTHLFIQGKQESIFNLKEIKHRYEHNKK